MAKNTAPKSAPAAARRPQVRQTITFELVQHHAPHAALADNLARTFGIEPVDFDSIREATEEHVARSAQALQGPLNEKALQIHLQRIVGAFVGSAYGATQFYGNKKSEALDLTAKLRNEHRDEDRDGVYGFDSKGARARQFAAEMGLQAFALLAAATGAVHAYAEIIGEDWKAYEAPTAPSSTPSRQSAEAELAALGG